MRKSWRSGLPTSLLFFCLVFFSLPTWAGSVRYLTEIAKLTASDGAGGAELGYSAAFSGNTIVVGAPGASSGFFMFGAAYVFVRPASGWMNMNQTAKLTSSYETTGLALSVATNGNTIVAGSPTDSNQFAGATANVYVEGVGGWEDMTQTAALTLPNPNIEAFGASSAITPSGNLLLVGAPEQISVYFNGGVALFKKPASGWENATLSSVILPPPATGAHEFGFAIAVDGDTVVISDPEANNFTGAVFVYKMAASRLTEIAELTPSDGDNDTFGWSVAISGSTIVAGAPNRSGVGAAYVFVEPPTGWTNMTETAQLTGSSASPAAQVGISVAIEGNTVAVGAPSANVGPNTAQGAVYGFVKPASGWTNMTETFVLLASDGAAGDQLGHSVAAGNGVIASGAWARSSYQGAVYVFSHP
jgi:hypothetical protein